MGSILNWARYSCGKSPRSSVAIYCVPHGGHHVALGVFWLSPPVHIIFGPTTRRKHRTIPHRGTDRRPDALHLAM